MNERNKSDFLTMSEVKQILNISLAAAYELANQKDFPVCRFGGSLRAPRKALMLWIDQHTQMPMSLREALATA